MTRLILPSILLALNTLYSTASGFAVAKLAHIKAQSISTSPLLPSQDPFYTAPPNFENAAPGAVLRVRQAADVTKFLTNCSAAYNILYRTTDSQYKPTWAVTTLYLPLPAQANATNSTSSTDYMGSANSTASDYNPGAYLLSYQTPYDSANIDLSPSYTVYGGSLNTYGVPALLGKGWYINVPDYEGPLASFTAGVQSGHATLDSIRAVLNSGFGLNHDVKYAMSGYSGGALASEWASELAVQYAPELTFSGVALGGLTPNVTSVLETINATPFSELIPNGILGLTSQYPDAETLLRQELKTDGPYNATTFLGLRNGSTDASIFAGQDFALYFKDGLDILQNPIFKRVQNRDGIMGYHGVPEMPIFAYKAIHDEISPINDTDTLISRYCAVGATILYERNSIGGHTAEFINGNQRQIDWLDAAFKGQLQQVYGLGGNGTESSVVGDCVVRDVSVNITTLAI